MVILDADGVVIKDMEGNLLNKEIDEIQWTSDMAKRWLQTFHAERDS